MDALQSKTEDEGETDDSDDEIEDDVVSCDSNGGMTFVPLQVVLSVLIFLTCSLKRRWCHAMVTTMLIDGHSSLLYPSLFQLPCGKLVPAIRSGLFAAISGKCCFESRTILLPLYCLCTFSGL